MRTNYIILWINLCKLRKAFDNQLFHVKCIFQTIAVHLPGAKLLCYWNWNCNLKIEREIKNWCFFQLLLFVLSSHKRFAENSNIFCVFFFHFGCFFLQFVQAFFIRLDVRLNECMKASPNFHALYIYRKIYVVNALLSI